jgi:hypothetical protein
MSRTRKRSIKSRQRGGCGPATCGPVPQTGGKRVTRARRMRSKRHHRRRTNNKHMSMKGGVCPCNKVDSTAPIAI